MTQTTTGRGLPAPAEHADDEWQLGAFDMDAYLHRIGYDGPLEPTAEVLRAIHLAHATTIPFENLDILLERGISLDMAAMQEKLLLRGRGGYCFEHNLLLSAVLEMIGFNVRRLVARVQPDKSGPRTHMMLNVHLDGEVWLADVGFGAALLEPVLLGDGVTVRHGAWTYGTRRRADGSWALREPGDGEGADLYAFTGESQHRVDYVIANHFTATHPSSPFVGQVVAIRTTPRERFLLRGLTLTTKRAGGASDERVIAPDELGEVLRTTFGIALEAGEVAHIRDHVDGE
jgi:N-hydroxyarylamine O-acetyltransferase